MKLFIFREKYFEASSMSLKSISLSLFNLLVLTNINYQNFKQLKQLKLIKKNIAKSNNLFELLCFNQLGKLNELISGLVT